MSSGYNLSTEENNICMKEFKKNKYLAWKIEVRTNSEEYVTLRYKFDIFLSLEYPLNGTRSYQYVEVVKPQTGLVNDS